MNSGHGGRGRGGRGRGALMRQLLESGRCLSHEDSGIEQSQAQALSLGTARSVGRGRLMESISHSSDFVSLKKLEEAVDQGIGRGHSRDITSIPSTSAGTPSIGRGRAQLLESLRQQSSSGSKHSDELDLLNLTTKTEGMTIRGRGMIFTEKATVIQPEEIQHVETKEESAGQNVEEFVEQTPVIKRGTHGVPVEAVCNYIRLGSDPNKGVFEYEVRFIPNVDSRNLRFKYLNEHRDKYGGTKTFDGVILYLPILLKDKITHFQSKNAADESIINIEIIYKRKKPLRECMHLYNVLFDRIMKTLNYVRFDRKQYDPTEPKFIPQHRLEIWPGYVTAVDEYEDGIMLCCDVSHRLLCQSTVLDLLRDIHRGSSPQLFQENAKKALLGSIVLTRYNNNTYRIDDINFDGCPTDNFGMHGREINYVDYYRIQYNIELSDLKQPLLISRKKRRVVNLAQPEELIYCLVPEICYLTGLRDDLRSDFKVMREIAAHTRVTPNHRALALRKFYKNINNSADARSILSDWGLTLSNEIEHLTGRQLDEEVIHFKRKQFNCGTNADFGRHATSNELLDVVNLTNWLLIHTRNDTKYATSFIKCLERNSEPMGIQVFKPRIKILDNDRTETYVNALRELITPNLQIVVLICPTSRDDRYAAIKKICCTEIPIPSQVINARTLSNESKNRAIVQKISLQMNCKLGGTLWSVHVPFQKVMVCGIDSYHDAGHKSNSVAAFVASLNKDYTRWYSRATISTQKEEIVNGLCTSLKYALKAYKELNDFLPEKIIVYRDGVGDGQLKLCAEYEIPQLYAACTLEDENYKPEFTFLVVQKRINTRIFIDLGRGELQNPNPGFILDHTITRRYLYDFFLVPQSVRQGTVTPTHYVVVHDSANFIPDRLQRFSYKLCFMYYNWPGTVRVPACCQYAHKLAYLVGQSIKRPTSEKLADKLFYL